MAITEPIVCSLIEETARWGGLLAKRQPGIAFDYKDDGTILSALDAEVQRGLRGFLAALPSDELAGANFVGEEDDGTGPAEQGFDRTRFNWVVDPIDGTAVYVRGRDEYAISIGLTDADLNPVLGLVHLPALRPSWYLASSHAGAPALYQVTFDGDKARLTPRQKPSVPPRWDSPAPPVERSYCHISSNGHLLPLDRFRGKMRALGAAASQIVTLVDGTDDPVVSIFSRCKAWDIAGGLAVTEAAGFETRDYNTWERLEYSHMFERGDGIAPPLPFIVGHPAALEIVREELQPPHPIVL